MIRKAICILRILVSLLVVMIFLEMLGIDMRLSVVTNRDVHGYIGVFNVHTHRGGLAIYKDATFGPPDRSYTYGPESAPKTDWGRDFLGSSIHVIAWDDWLGFNVYIHGWVFILLGAVLYYDKVAIVLRRIKRGDGGDRVGNSLGEKKQHDQE